MRKAPGKERGYVILPVVIPAGMEPDKALNDNKPYKVVWQVLQRYALTMTSLTLLSTNWT